MMLSACNESLPVREDIASLVTIGLSSRYYVVPNSDVSGAAGQLQFFVTIKNNTDDVLEDVARLEGTMEITWVPRRWTRTLPCTGQVNITDPIQHLQSEELLPMLPSFLLI